MKLEHVVVAVEVVRYRSIADAQDKARFGKLLIKIPTLWAVKPDPVLAQLMSAPLYHEFEGQARYERTCAIVAPAEEVKIAEFHRQLAALDYYPASFSEAVSYLRVLAERGTKIDKVLHLGLFILDGEYRERRLLMRSNWDMELETVYPTTKLKPYHRVVVVKAVKKYQQK